MNTARTMPARLPEAVAPPERRGLERDAVRLLVTDRATGRHRHARFFALPEYLRAGDLLVVNDSATVPAALRAQGPGGQRLMLHVATMLDERLWLAEPRGTVRSGARLRLPGGGSAVILAPAEPAHPRVWYVRFDLPQPMYEFLALHGEPIRYDYVSESFPLADYQTLFARVPGSSEMPSAARPFTPRVVGALQERGIEFAALTLHCGVASFEAPERPAIERFSVSLETAEAVNRARREGRRVIAIGTTVLRALESARHRSNVVASAGWTDRIIDAATSLTVADGLLTGFHDAGATHQWIVSALLDRATVRTAYAEAAERGYLQHEFGDVHLILSP